LKVYFETHPEPIVFREILAKSTEIFGQNYPESELKNILRYGVIRRELAFMKHTKLQFGSEVLTDLCMYGPKGIEITQEIKKTILKNYLAPKEPSPQNRQALREKGVESQDQDSDLLATAIINALPGSGEYLKKKDLIAALRTAGLISPLSGLTKEVLACIKKLSNEGKIICIDNPYPSYRLPIINYLIKSSK